MAKGIDNANGELHRKQRHASYAVRRTRTYKVSRTGREETTRALHARNGSHCVLGEKRKAGRWHAEGDGQTVRITEKHVSANQGNKAQSCPSGPFCPVIRSHFCLPRCCTAGKLRQGGKKGERRPGQPIQALALQTVAVLCRPRLAGCPGSCTFELPSCLLTSTASWLLDSPRLTS